MKIAIDIDGVVGDLGTPWLAKFNYDAGKNVKYEDIHTWDIDRYTGPEIYSYLTPELYNSIKIVPGAKFAIDQLREAGHTVFFCTGAIGVDRSDWLVDNRLGNAQSIVYTENKHLIDASVLIDDNLDNLVSFCGGRKERAGILFDQPWNRKFDIREQDALLARVYTWDQIPSDIAILSCGHEKHPTEVARPEQVRAFRQIIEQMYQVHLDKNADYSPANIAGVGELGLMTRVWDKVARLMNLMGFNIELKRYEYTGRKNEKFEAIDDTILDLAVYSIVWQIYRQGKWGI